MFSEIINLHLRDEGFNTDSSNNNILSIESNTTTIMNNTTLLDINQNKDILSINHNNTDQINNMKSKSRGGGRKAGRTFSFYDGNIYYYY